MSTGKNVSQQNPPVAVTTTIRAKKPNKQPCSTCSIKRKGMQPPSATETAMKKAAKCDHKHATDQHKHHPIAMHSHETSRNIIFNNGA